MKTLMSKTTYNTHFLYNIIMLASIMPISFTFMGQEHMLVFNFLTLSQIFETFNLMMMGLTGWIAALMMLISYKYNFNGTDNTMNNSNSSSLFTALVMSVLAMSISFFCTNHMVFFYMFFEASALPTLMLIMKWGYQPERLQASYYFIMYTVCGSLPLLMFLLNFTLLTQTPYFNYYGFSLITACMTTPLMLISGLLAFLVKAPLWGTHLWLPKAHVEAPVSGSMILAGVLLKLGGYGLIKVYLTGVFLKMHWPYAVLATGLWGILVISMVCLRQTDMKIMIAYSSVIHMSMMLLGLMSGSYVGFLGAMTMMIIHGFSSPGMFMIANYNYENTGSRNLFMHKGFHLLQPTSAMIWFVLLSCNMAAPPFMSLASELMVVVSMMKLGFLTVTLLGLTTLLSLTYNLYLFSSQQGATNMTMGQSYNMRGYTFLSMFLMVMPCMVSIMPMQLFMI